MNWDEFLKEIQSKKDAMTFMPPASERSVEMAQSTLMQMQRAMLAPEMARFYLRTDGILCQDACIYSLSEVQRNDRKYVWPSITSINNDFSGFPMLRGKTIFGRNSLFWFAIDVEGTAWMLDLMTLTPIKKYSSIYRAFYECLIVGII